MKRQNEGASVQLAPTSASFIRMLLLQFGYGGAHVGFEFFRLSHQGCIGGSPLSFESHQLLASQFVRYFQHVLGSGLQEKRLGGIAYPDRASGDLGLPVNLPRDQQSDRFVRRFAENPLAAFEIVIAAGKLDWDSFP